jgi:hypothetical protein
MARPFALDGAGRIPTSSHKIKIRTNSAGQPGGGETCTVNMKAEGVCSQNATLTYVGTSQNVRCMYVFWSHTIPQPQIMRLIQEVFI